MSHTQSPIVFALADQPPPPLHFLNFKHIFSFIGLKKGKNYK